MSRYLLQSSLMASTTVAARRYNILLLSIVVTTTPIAALLLWFNYAAVVLAEQRTRLSFQKRKSILKKTVLITGTECPYGLNLARAFHRQGHRVIGSDLSDRGFLSIANKSRALSKHYSLPRQANLQNADYIARCILIIVEKESVDLWIDCSHDLPLDTIATAQTQLQEKSACACFLADTKNFPCLENGKTFVDFLRKRSLPAPEVHQVRSRSDIHNVLNRSQGRKQFVLTSPEQARPFNKQTLLPRRTLSQTYHDVSLVKISPGSHMVLEEYPDPAITYECFAIVVQGVVKFFWAGQELRSSNGYLRDDTALWRSMRAYTDAIARELGGRFSSHLTLTFGVIERASQDGVESKLLLLKGAYQLDRSFVLPASEGSDLVQAYASVLQRAPNGTATHETAMSLPPSASKQLAKQRYFLMEDTTSLLLRPCIGLLQRRTSVTQALTSIVTLLHRLLFWDEAYYDFWDPVPAFWHYSVLLPWTTLLSPIQH